MTSGRTMIKVMFLANLWLILQVMMCIMNQEMAIEECFLLVQRKNKIGFSMSSWAKQIQDFLKGMVARNQEAIEWIKHHRSISQTKLLAYLD